MVDALEETWRVLTANGVFIDLRPISSKCQIEVVTPEIEIQIGEIDAFGAAADDAAADKAVRQVVKNGKFSFKQYSNFKFEFYWDTIFEMRSFNEGSKRMGDINPSYSELEEVYQKLNAKAGNRAHLRCRRHMMLAIHHKTSR